MPKYKIQRRDVIREEDVEALLNECKKNLKEGYKILSINRGFLKVKIIPERLQCLIALLWLFGKRNSEVLKIKRKDISITDTHLEIQFIVLKKKTKTGHLERRLKRITRKNKYTTYIVDYIQKKLFIAGNKDRVEKNMWLFPGKCSERTRKVHVKWKVKGVVKEKDYFYTRKDEGRWSIQHVWSLLQALNEEVWAHAFRKSLATRMAEAEATEDELMRWFDWDSAKVAHDYVLKYSPKIGKRFEEREW